MTDIKRTCGTAIGGVLFISMLISGNSVSKVEANCLTDENIRIVHSDTAEICKTYTLKNGINYSLSGYNTYNQMYKNVENVVMNEEKMDNLKKLDRIALLENGWNGSTAKAFDENLISKVRKIITVLEIQPEIFPTACESIQMEYEKEDGSYLEIEINSDDKWEVFKINSDGEETYFSIVADVEAIIKLVNEFYG